MSGKKIIPVLLFALVALVLLLVICFFVVPDFPRNLLGDTHFFSEYAAVAVAVYCYRWLKDSFMKWFLPFQVFIFSAELAASNLNHKWNSNLYFLVSIIESLFYGYIFYHLSSGKRSKDLIAALAVLSAFAQAFSWIAFEFGWVGNTLLVNCVASGFVICVVSLVYLYDRSDSDSGPMLSEPGFWLALGASLFYSGVSISWMSPGIITRHHISLFGVPLLNMIPRLLCIVLYGCTCITMLQYAKSRSEYQLNHSKI